MADPINEILTFALGPDENVVDQDIYDELAARVAGFPKGLLPSAQINKVLRQSAFVASAVAQLVASTLNEDVLDDGDRDALVTQLVATIATLASVDAPVQSVAGRTGNVVLDAADIADSGAAGRQVVQAATAAAIKSILAIAAADITDSGAAGRTVLQGVTAAAIRATLGLGSAALAAATDFDASGAAAAVLASSLQKSSNLADLTNAATARTSLGLGTAAQAATGDFDAAGAAAAVLASSLQKAQNLADLPNAATARTSLGLGSAALSAATAFDAAGAAAAAQAAAIAATRSLPVSDGNANRDLTSADCWVRWIRMTRASANTASLSLANLGTMADGDEISGIQAGAGQTTLTFEGGITVLNTPGLKTRAQGSPWTIKRVDATHVDVIGDLSA